MKKRAARLALLILFIGAGGLYYQFLYPHARRVTVLYKNDAELKFHEVRSTLTLERDGDAALKAGFFFSAVGLPATKVIEDVPLKNGGFTVKIVQYLYPVKGAPGMRQVFAGFIELEGGEDIFLTVDLKSGLTSL